MRLALLLLFYSLCKTGAVFSDFFKKATLDWESFNNNIKEIIFAHRDSAIIFHFDRTGSTFAEEIIQNLNSHTTKSIKLICYKQDMEKDKLFKRPLINSVLNVILLQNLQQFNNFLSASQYVSERDEAFFILTDPKANLTYFSKNSYLKVFGKILIIDVRSGVKSVCYFCGNLTGSFNQVERIMVGRKDFKNFQDHIFRIGFTEYFPLISCEKSDKNVCKEAVGTECELIQVVARQLNFSYALIVYLNYESLIRDLENGKIDFVIGGITATSERSKKATFTRQYWFEGYHFLYLHSANLRREFRRIFDPFEGRLWILLLISIVVTSVLLYGIDRVENRDLSVTCSESLRMCLYVAIEQNVNLKRIFKCRTGQAVLLSAWILVCLNVSTAYKSKLSAIVLNPPDKEPEDMKELLDNDYKFVVNERYRDVFVSLLFNTSDLIVQQALSNTAIRNGLCEEFDYAVEERAAILDEYTSLQYELRKSCRRNLKAKSQQTQDNFGTTRMRITKKSLRIIGHVWLLQRNAVYSNEFDRVLGRILEAGLLDRWKTTFAKEMRKGSFHTSRKVQNKHYQNPVSLRILLSTFLVYLIGNCLGIVAFLAENYCNKSKR